jgi:hypothetical protein
MKVTINRPVEVDVIMMLVNAVVRHPENAYTRAAGTSQWIEENPDEPSMPYLYKDGDKYYWRPVIDLDKGQILNWPKDKEAKLCYKVVDEFYCVLNDSNGNSVSEYNDYVPRCMQLDEEGYGDYIYITIDSEGYIKNWAGFDNYAYEFDFE